MKTYDWMLILPQKISEGEEWQIEVSPLEACETGDYNDGKEEFFDVL